MRKLCLLAALALLTIPLAACGKKAAPSVPSAEAEGYPHTYPRKDTDLGSTAPAPATPAPNAPGTSSPGLAAPVPDQ